MKEALSIQELATEIKRRSETKVDYIARTRDLLFEATPVMQEVAGAVGTGDGTHDLGGGHVVITEWYNERLGRALDSVAPKPLAPAHLQVKTSAGIQDLLVNGVAHDQLGLHLGIPAKYYDRLLSDFPALLTENVNTLLAAAPPTEYRTVRSLDGVARAFLSDSYELLDNWDLMRFLLPVFAPKPTAIGNGKFIQPVRAPGGGPLNVVFRSCDITDKRLYIKVVVPSIQAELKVGTVVRAGVVIQNSEVGYGKVAVFPFYEVLACTNGAIMEKLGNTRRHVGRAKGPDGDGNDAYRFYSDETKRAADKAFFLGMADVVRGTLTEAVFNRMLEPMRAAMSTRIEGHPEAAVAAVGRRMDLTEGEQDDILRHLIDGGDLSVWGLSNAVTRHAQDAPSYDRATELEKAGGDIITLGADEWHVIATARNQQRRHLAMAGRS